MQTISVSSQAKALLRKVSAIFVENSLFIENTSEMSGKWLIYRIHSG